MQSRHGRVKSGSTAAAVLLFWNVQKISVTKAVIVSIRSPQYIISGHFNCSHAQLRETIMLVLLTTGHSKSDFD
jgi:hypothetical protein